MLSLYYQTEPDEGVQIPNCTTFSLRNRDSVYATKNVYISSTIESLLDQPVNKFYKSTYNGSLAYFPIEVGQLDPAFFYENVFGLIDSEPLALFDENAFNPRVCVDLNSSSLMMERASWTDTAWQSI